MASTISAGTSAGTAIAIAGDTSGALALQTNNGTTAVTIDTSQNVGIGTTSPSRKLTVYAIGSSVPAVITNDQSQSRICFKDSVTALDYTVGIGSIGENLASYTGGTERMRIDSSGNVLVNTTSLNSGKVNIVASGSSQPCMIWNDSDATSASQGIVSIRRNGSAVGLISTTNTNTTYATSSDYRLKENIVPMVGALATVSALKPVTYKWKSTGEESQGFIAHELQSVLPDCVTGEKDAVKTVDELDEDGKVIGTKEVPQYQGIDTSFLVATLTAAIQELNAKVEAQATTIAELQAKVG